MSTFAKIENDTVVNVIEADQAHIDSTYPDETWVEYTPATANYPGIGYEFDSKLGVFVLPKQFDSWIKDTVTGQWKAPTEMPSDGKSYYWNEVSQSWVELPEPPNV
jgi:hypothetical protein